MYQAAAGGASRPCMWIHGGALIMGSRKWLDDAFHAEIAKRGFVVVSIDYRLAPETKLPGIIDDVQDAWRWVRQEGPKRFGIDPDRIAVAGGSAGGYLTLMTGFCLEPRPRALVSYFGYGDITTPWYSEPDEFYRRKPLVPKEEAYRCVGSRALSEPPAQNQRGRFYLYCRQQGIWPNEVAGHNPHAEPKWFDPYCPIRNVTAKYPPTFLDPWDRRHRRALRGIEEHGRQAGGGGRHPRVHHGRGGRPRAVGGKAGAGGADCPAGRRLCQDPYLIETIATLKVGDRVRVGWYCDERKRAAKVQVIAPAPKAKETPSE